MTAQDELTDDVWHILLHVYSYQHRSCRLQAPPPTRIELADELVALSALAESIVMRIARLADKRRDSRSIKNFCKGQHLAPQAKVLADKFYEVAKPVVSIRHERIAHMKAGDLSAYPVDALPPAVLPAVETLVLLVDAIQARSIRYLLKVGSQERLVDLRTSVMRGKRVEV
jgi:hypothetical protein